MKLSSIEGVIEIDSFIVVLEVNLESYLSQWA